MSGIRNGNAPPSDMMRMPATAVRRNPSLCSTAPDAMLTGTDTMPVMLLANMMAVMSVSTK